MEDVDRRAERKFQEAVTWPRSENFPLPGAAEADNQGRWSSSFALVFRCKGKCHLREGIRYPAHMASIAAIHVDTGKIDELKDSIKGPGTLLRHIAGLERSRPEAVLHHRQQRFAGPERL